MSKNLNTLFYSRKENLYQSLRFELYLRLKRNINDKLVEDLNRREDLNKRIVV
jgi:hypothetical protein